MKEVIAVLIVAGVVFGLCFLVDLVFKKIFRRQSQHQSGKAVRLNKRYGSIGLILTVFAVAVLFAGLPDNWLFIAGSVLMMLVGIGLVVYYLTFGVFYDDDSFVLTTFGKKSTTYYYKQIQGQQLYVTTGGGVVVEIYMKDGRTFQIQSAMAGGFEFLDKAFFAWLRQTGRRQEDCDFYDPENSCWFPKMEDK